MTADFERYQDMIHSRAWSFHRSTGLPWEEFYSAGLEAFVRAQRKKQDQATFGVFLYRALSNAMTDVCRDQARQKLFRPLEEIDLELPAREARRPLADKLAVLSEEAREVVTLVLTAPQEIAEDLFDQPNRRVRGMVREHLREARGWSWSSIWRVLRELKEWTATL